MPYEMPSNRISKVKIKDKASKGIHKTVNPRMVKVRVKGNQCLDKVVMVILCLDKVCRVLELEVDKVAMVILCPVKEAVVLKVDHSNSHPNKVELVRVKVQEARHKIRQTMNKDIRTLLETWPMHNRMVKVRVREAVMVCKACPIL
jgi:hypothetical protein